MKNILCFGDSNTWGFIPGSFDLATLASQRYDANTRWTGILANLLGKEFKIIEEGLNGRTTVLNDPPRGDFVNGKTYLYPCLMSHKPLDMVVLMLGSNDLKNYFNIGAGVVALNVRQLVWMIRSIFNKSQTKILIIAPPVLTLEKSEFYGTFDQSSVDKSKQLAAEYAMACQYEDCHFLDAAKLIKCSKKDGVHFEENEHRILGEAVAQVIRKIVI